MRYLTLAVAVVMTNVSGLAALHAQEAPDLILMNGKIVTVDAFFSIHEAVAVRGERVVAVGSSERISALAGPATRTIDLTGRTLIPGLIDNHNHVIRATEYWPNEARLDGVTSRAEALTLLNAKADALAEGEWLMSLGGWTEGQFVDSQADFTLAELDGLARDRPVFIQSVYDHAFGNSAWFEAMGISMAASANEQASATGLAAHVVRDISGRATGRLNGGFPMVALAIERFPEVPAERQAQAIQASFSYMNSIGLTTIYDPAGTGIQRESYARIRALADEDGLTLRVYHTLGGGGTPSTPEHARELIDDIMAARPFQGDASLDLISVGEIYYAPFHWDNPLDPAYPNEADIAIARDILTVAARGGWQVQSHAVQPETIDHLLDVITEVNAEQPVRQLRWSITHADNISAEQIERAKGLGMNLQLRSNPVLGGREPIFEKFGERAYHMPPLRLIQDSAIPFGLGTDGTKAGQINPFVTLYWAVTGKALNGEIIQRELLTREEALIAATRSNAYLMFQEGQIGAIKPGLLADMLVLDRDYLTVPVEEIKEILPVATIVGGRIVHGEL